MKKRIVSILLVLFLCTAQAGCWDAQEINELGFVLSVALDKAGNGYRVTAQIAKPDTYSKTPTGSGSQAQDKPFWVVSATGNSVFEAIRNLAVVSPRRIFWAHIKIIIIGEPLARSGIHEVLDFFTRNPELRLRTLVAVAPGEAGKLLDVVPVMEKDPATHLERITENRSLTGKGYRNMLKNFLEEYLEPNGSPVTSRVVLSQTENKPDIELNGAAVFSKSKMVGWLDGKETKGLLWLKNEIGNSVMVINCPYDSRPITIEIKAAGTSFNSYVEEGIPYFVIKVEATGSLVEQGCTTDFTDPQVLQELETAMAAAIQNDIHSTLTAAQTFGVDFIGLNEVLHRQHKEEWQRLTANWPEAVKAAEFQIDVTADIPSVSLLAKPLVPAEAPLH